MIKVVVFDLGNVIISVNFYSYYQIAAQMTGYDPEKIEKLVLESGLVAEYETGKLSSLEFKEKITRKLKLEIGFEDFSRIWCDIFTENKEVFELIRALKGKYRLFLLSNTNELHFYYAVEKFPVLMEFEEYILSYRIGCTKPDPVIFREAIRRAGCKPDELVYIDDIPEYAAAAQNLGIQGINFCSSAQLKEELLSRKVYWKGG